MFWEKDCLLTQAYVGATLIDTCCVFKFGLFSMPEHVLLNPKYNMCQLIIRPESDNRKKPI